jgi:hypothetical protein
MEVVVGIALLLFMLPLVANLLPMGVSSNKKAAVMQVAAALGGQLVEEAVYRPSDFDHRPISVGQHEFMCSRTARLNAQGLLDISVRVEHPRIAPVKLVTRVAAPESP